MFISDQVAYLALHKTGSTHLEMLLEKVVGGAIIGKHERLPEEFSTEGKLVLGSVRDPWDWYVSLWAYGCAGRGGLFQRLTSPPRLSGHGFKTRPSFAAKSLLRELAKSARAWRHTYSDANNPALFRAWLRRVLSPRHKFELGEDYALSPIAEFSGIYTYRYANLYFKRLDLLYSPAVNSMAGLDRLLRDNHIADVVIRNERLEDDLVAALKQAGIELTEAQRALIYSGRRTNASRRTRRLADYYDEETVDLVRQKAWALIEKYGYAPPEPSRG